MTQNFPKDSWRNEWQPGSTAPVEEPNFAPHSRRNAFLIGAGLALGTLITYVGVSSADRQESVLIPETTISSTTQPSSYTPPTETIIPSASTTPTPQNTATTIPTSPQNTSSPTAKTSAQEQTVRTSTQPPSMKTGVYFAYTEQSASSGAFTVDIVSAGGQIDRSAEISLECRGAVPWSGMQTSKAGAPSKTYPVYGFPKTPSLINPCDTNGNVKESAKTKPGSYSAFLGSVALANGAADWVIEMNK